MTAPKTIAYLCVSTNDQDLEKNRAEILNLANEKTLGKVHWMEGTVPGKVPWKKRKIAGIIEELGAGDNLIVNELSRLARSRLERMEILSLWGHIVGAFLIVMVTVLSFLFQFVD